MLTVVPCLGLFDWQTDKQYVIKADLPGVKKEDVKVRGPGPLACPSMLGLRPAVTSASCWKRIGQEVLGYDHV